MSRRFFSGTTVEQAVLKAAQHFGLEPERVAYQARDKKHGFVNIRRKVVIEIDPSSPELPAGQKTPWEPKLAGRPERGRADAPPPARPAAGDGPKPAASREPVADRGPRPERNNDVRRSAPPRPSAESMRPKPEPKPETDDPLEAADLALDEIAEVLYYDLQWDIHLTADEGIEVELSGDDSGRVIEDSGRVLRAIEHLLPRVVRSKLGRGISCSIDCEGFKAAHAAALETFARQVASEVASSGEGRLLEPMTPADRRVVHVTLADHPAVVTESEGGGFAKRVRVSPAG